MMMNVVVVEAGIGAITAIAIEIKQRVNHRPASGLIKVNLSTIAEFKVAVIDVNSLEAHDQEVVINEDMEVMEEEKEDEVVQILALGIVVEEKVAERAQEVAA